MIALQIQDLGVWGALRQAVLIAVRQEVEAGALNGKQVAQVLWEASHYTTQSTRHYSDYSSGQVLMTQQAGAAGGTSTTQPSSAGPSFFDVYDAIDNGSPFLKRQPLSGPYDQQHNDGQYVWIHDMEQLLILSLRDSGSQAGMMTMVMTSGAVGEPLGGEALAQIMAAYAAWGGLPSPAWMDVLEKELQMGAFLMTPGAIIVDNVRAPLDDVSWV
jgi:hypothetical protein